jgi:hypothetical protein
VSADVEVRPAPIQPQAIDQQGTVIAFGSPGYNSVSGHIETACGSAVHFTPGNTAIQLPGGLTVQDPLQSVVVRLKSGDRYWFYAAGLSEGGTAAAAFYLARHWRRLDRVFRKSPSFYVLVELSGADFRNTRVIAEAAM